MDPASIALAAIPLVSKIVEQFMRWADGEEEQFAASVTKILVEAASVKPLDELRDELKHKAAVEGWWVHDTQPPEDAPTLKPGQEVGNDEKH